MCFHFCYACYYFFFWQITIQVIYSLSFFFCLLILIFFRFVFCIYNKSYFFLLKIFAFLLQVHRRFTFLKLFNYFFFLSFSLSFSSFFLLSFLFSYLHLSHQWYIGSVHCLLLFFSIFFFFFCFSFVLFFPLVLWQCTTDSQFSIIPGPLLDNWTHED